MKIDRAEINKTVFYWLLIAKKDLIENYDRLGLRASGKYEKDLEVTETKTGGNIKSAKHWGAMEYGRKKSENEGPTPLWKIITEWVKIKGITPQYGTIEQMIFAITKKIHKFGIKVPNKYNAGKVVSSVITDDRIDRLVEAIKKNVINGLNK